MAFVSMVVRPFNSVRGRFLLLVLLVLAAPLAVLVHGAEQARGEEAREVAAEIMTRSALAAVEHQQRLEAAHQFLEVVAGVPAVTGLDREACSQLTGRLLKKYNLYANISSAYPNGEVFCSAHPEGEADNWASRPWFQKALSANDVVVGDYEIDSIAKIPVLTLAHPVRDESGALLAVAALTLPVDWLAGYVAGDPGKQDLSLDILNAGGAILVRYPNPENRIGQRDTVDEFAAAVRSMPEAGNLEGTGVDGVRRLYAYARLVGRPETEQRYLRIGLPVAVAYAGANQLLRENLILLAASAVIALIAAWLAGGLLVLRPLGSLLRVTGALQGGDLAARAGPPYVKGELGELAQAFDGMAAALAARELEREAAEAKVKALNTELERRVAERTEELDAANRELLRYAQEQSTLYSVSAAIAGTLEPRELLASVLETVLAAFDADAGWVLVADRVLGAQRSVPVWKGVSEDFVRAEVEIPPDNCLACGLLAPGQPCCETRTTRPCPRLSTASLEAAGLRRQVSVPMATGSRVRGILNLAWRSSHSLSEAECALLATVGQQLNVALEKAELYAAATVRARRLAVLNKSGEALTASLDLDCVLDALVDFALTAAEAQAAAVALVSPASDDDLDEEEEIPAGKREPVFVYRRAAGPGAEEIVGLAAGGLDNLLRRALDTRHCVLQQGPAGDEPAGWRGGSPVGGTVYCLPLIAGERLIGILELAKDTTVRSDEEDLRLLEALADQAAVAIENALLYQRQRAQYRRLEESQAQLVQAEKSAALGGLAASLAHEINNPLQSLRGHIEMATDFPLTRQERAEYLLVARQEIVRLSEITHRILNFYRPAQTARRLVKVDELVEQALLLLGKQLEQASIQVSRNGFDSEPVLAAPDQLMQVFINVLINAIQAMPQSGRIEIATWSDSSAVILSFTNDGPPIAEENLSRIFAPNFTTKIGGTGLGLFIARNIVQQHGGTILGENLEHGQGVVFTIRLPKAAASENS